MKIAIFGDVGGHYDRLSAALGNLGCDAANYTIPDDTVIIQVGDLIHRGPESDRCIELADTMMLAHPRQWHQIFGNHEGQYVGGPEFWVPEISAMSVETLQRWWDDGVANMAVAVELEDGRQVLITHAGLTWILWHSVLENNSSAAECAREINAWQAELAFSAGGMLQGQPLHAGGPAWAEAARELCMPWWRHEGEWPFSQVYGHSSIYWWNKRQWSSVLSPELLAAAELDTERRHVIVRRGSHSLTGIDPAFGREAFTAIHPLVLEGVVCA